MNPGKQGYRVPPEFLTGLVSEFWAIDQETKELATEKFKIASS
jgi:hypothetical protein